MTKRRTTRPRHYESDDDWEAPKTLKQAVKEAAQHQPSSPAPCKPVRKSTIPVRNHWRFNTPLSKIAIDLQDFDAKSAEWAICPRIVRFKNPNDLLAWNPVYGEDMKHLCTIQDFSAFLRTAPKVLNTLGLFICESTLRAGSTSLSMDTHCWIAVQTRDIENDPKTIYIWDSNSWSKMRSKGILEGGSVHQKILSESQKVFFKDIWGKRGHGIERVWFGGRGNQWEFLKNQEQQDMEEYELAMVVWSAWSADQAVRNGGNRVCETESSHGVPASGEEKKSRDKAPTLPVKPKEVTEEEEDVGVCLEEAWHFLHRLSITVADGGGMKVDISAEKFTPLNRRRPKAGTRSINKKKGRATR